MRRKSYKDRPWVRVLIPNEPTGKVKSSTFNSLLKLTDGHSIICVYSGPRNTKTETCLRNFCFTNYLVFCREGEYTELYKPGVPFDHAVAYE